jgi:hypothetical protein
MASSFWTDGYNRLVVHGSSSLAFNLAWQRLIKDLHRGASGYSPGALRYF